MRRNLTKIGDDSPLCSAAMDDHFDEVVELLAAGADVNHRGQYGRTPLHHARSVRVAEYLLDRGAELAAKNAGGDTPLRDRILHSDDVPELARLYIGRGLPIAGHLAAAANARREETVVALLELGANPDEPTSLGEPAILAALSIDPPKGNAIALHLLRAGASLDIAGRLGTTLFQRLCGRRDAGLVAFAIKRGANIRHRTNTFGGDDSALCIAARAGDPDVVTVLIEAELPVDDRGHDGMTPLMCAAREARIDVVELLLHCGASRDAVDDKGNRPLHHAVHGGNLAIWNRVRGEHDLDAENNNGATPLYLASAMGRLPLVKELVAAGAAIDHRAHDGTTSLMAAARAGHEPVCGFLNMSGADAAIRDASDKTAGDHAVDHTEALRRAWEDR